MIETVGERRIAGILNRMFYLILILLLLCAWYQYAQFKLMEHLIEATKAQKQTVVVDGRAPTKSTLSRKTSPRTPRGLPVFSGVGMRKEVSADD